MGSRKVVVKQSAADSIAAIAWFIESKEMIKTAENFVDNAYDFFLQIADTRKSYSYCREPLRSSLGYKCLPYKKKYTVVFIESEAELVICEFVASKLIYW